MERSMVPWIDEEKCIERVAEYTESMLNIIYSPFDSQITPVTGPLPLSSLTSLLLNLLYPPPSVISSPNQPKQYNQSIHRLRLLPSFTNLTESSPSLSLSLLVLHIREFYQVKTPRLFF
ncbi:hypothetical protein EYC80_001353 [Monilinia laxa]|uniref:Uncharacterized protein n=1 Tax=Monilinia laxa TaxID=61186 RepID=A0A5N6K9Y7_MONLA|nr:hypothetical protein EYC80_001353 [Monilinia laxa]